MRTADITDLPFDDNSVDVVVSSLVVHNISDPAARAKAISEADGSNTDACHRNPRQQRTRWPGPVARHG